MTNLYGQAAALDNMLRNINSRLQSAERVLGTQSELYEKYRAEIDSMFGGTGLVTVSSDGSVKVSRTAKAVMQSGVSMKRVQHALEFMGKHNLKDEKKRIAGIIKEQEKEKRIAEIENRKKAAFIGPLLPGTEPKIMQPKPSEIGRIKAPSKEELKAKAKNLYDSEEIFDDIMKYIYDHTDENTIDFDPSPAAQALRIMRQKGDVRTYGELRRVASLAIQHSQDLQSQGIPDYVPESMQQLNRGEDLY